MQRMTIGGAFGAMIDFIRTSWLVILGTLLAAGVITGLLGFAAIGSTMETFANQTPGAAPPDPAQAMQAFSRLWLVFLGAGVLFYAASFLSWRHGLTGGSESVFANIGWAVGASLTSMLTMLVVGIVLIIALYAIIAVVALIFIAVFGLSGAGVGDLMSPAASAGLGAGVIASVILFYILFFVGFYWVYGRFSAAGPVMAVQRTVNPITGLSESWRLTKSSQWVIVGFFLLQLLLSFVALIVISVVGGGAAALMNPAQPPAAMGIVPIVLMIVVYVPLILMSIATPPAIYRQVAGADAVADDVFA